MPSESLHDTPVPCDAGSTDKSEAANDPDAPDTSTDVPGELSEFSQRLASFGLGEAPDPLLTEARHTRKRGRQS
ncbi:MAG: hypothetical protein ACREMZ_09370 [Gemmatimonadales bacterium]